MSRACRAAVQDGGDPACFERLQVAPEHRHTRSSPAGYLRVGSVSGTPAWGWPGHPPSGQAMRDDLHQRRALPRSHAAPQGAARDAQALPNPAPACRGTRRRRLVESTTVGASSASIPCQPRAATGSGTSPGPRPAARPARTCRWPRDQVPGCGGNGRDGPQVGDDPHVRASVARIRLAHGMPPDERDDIPSRPAGAAPELS